MGKSLYIAEKPSVAQEFARVLGIRAARHDGYLEGPDAVVTWCVGHLVTMSYPESYDPALKRWAMNTLPFIPSVWKYQIIDSVKKQFGIVKEQLNRADVDTIYVCTDSGREGEYIYRLVRQEAHVTGKTEKRVWIDSQTEEEILRGIREAKDISCYDHLADAAYLRAKEDYLMGINFSRVLTLKFGSVIADSLREKRAVLSVGRVMTCVLGMVVRREREIRHFVKTPFYRVTGLFGGPTENFEAEWRAQEGSVYFESPKLYKENGFRKKEDAEELIRYLSDTEEKKGTVAGIEKKQEKKNPPLLFNLAELQNECSKRLKKSPDETLSLVQELYEKKLVTYPRTDARVLSSAVAKEIRKNISGLSRYETAAPFVSVIIENNLDKGIGKSIYTDDKKITDHYAIIPTGQGLSALSSLSPLHRQVYDLIVRRFLCIFYPPAKYEKLSLILQVKTEKFFSSFRFLKERGYLEIWESDTNRDPEEKESDASLFKKIGALKKGMTVPLRELSVKEGETTPPKRYTSGSLILAMENAGQLIEDEELRAQIKGSGIGTSATRAEIIKKLTVIRYLKIQNKTQVVTPELLGEMCFDVVEASMKQLLNPDLTASWEKGLSYVAEGTITADEYMEKLTGFVRRRTDAVRQIRSPENIRPVFEKVLPFYEKKGRKG